jgi:hypothetical protein
MKIKKGQQTLEVTEKAYNVVYKARGYKPVKSTSTKKETTNKE